MSSLGCLVFREVLRWVLSFKVMCFSFTVSLLCGLTVCCWFGLSTTLLVYCLSFLRARVSFCCAWFGLVLAARR